MARVGLQHGKKMGKGYERTKRKRFMEDVSVKIWTRAMYMTLDPL
jgi:hypothetical protein